jgi:glucokinase
VTVAKGTAGVDLGGTKIQTVVLAGRRVVGSARVPTPQTGADDVIDAMLGAVRDVAAQAGIDPAALGAVGIGAPGHVDLGAGTVSDSPNVAGFERAVPLGARISEALGGVPVRVDNDVRVATWGEFKLGAGRTFRNLIGVFVGTGVGGGLILEGRLRVGRGAAGEIGHTVVKHGGRPCGCGRQGCLEAYAGRRSMEATARRWAARGRKTDLFEIQRARGRPNVTSGVFAAALDKHDAVAEELIKDAVWALGTGLASAQNLLDVEAFVLGGGLGDRLGAPFVARIEAEMRPHLFVQERPPAMLTTELGDLGGAIGAAVRARG